MIYCPQIFDSILNFRVKKLNLNIFLKKGNTFQFGFCNVQKLKHVKGQNLLLFSLMPHNYSLVLPERDHQILYKKRIVIHVLNYEEQNERWRTHVIYHPGEYGMLEISSSIASFPHH